MNKYVTFSDEDWIIKSDNLHYFHPNYRVHKKHWITIFLFIYLFFFFPAIVLLPAFIDSDTIFVCNDSQRTTLSFPQSLVSTATSLFLSFLDFLFLLPPWRRTNKEKLSIVSFQIWTLCNLVLSLYHNRISPVKFGHDQ